MYEHYSATVAIRGDLGWFGKWRALRVFIDGQPARSSRRDDTKEYLVLPGIHFITVSLASVWSAPTWLALQPGDWVELICTSNQIPPHPWMIRGIVYAVAICTVTTAFLPLSGSRKRRRWGSALH